MRLFAFIAVLVILLGSALGLLARSGASETPTSPYRVTARAYDRLQPGMRAVIVINAGRVAYKSLTGQARSSAATPMQAFAQD